MAGAKNKKARKRLKKFLRDRHQQLRLRSHLAETVHSRKVAKQIAKLYDEQLTHQK